MKPVELDCPDARVHLSARLDGEPHDARALESHLAGCEPCRGHERSLRALAGHWDALREATPPADLWERIARHARPVRTRVRPHARVAAALIGFLGLGAAALVLERREAPAPPGTHLLERLASAPAPGASLAFLEPLPEYRLLRRPAAEETSR